jgi:4-amino-4-deoxy-L-arabinose transferase-like glycosyltransferase
MSEGLYTLLIAATLLAALRLRDRGDARSAALLGASVGLAALTRSEALLLFPLLVLPVALTRPGDRLRLAAVSVVTAVVLIAPWTARNWVELDRPVLISTNDGTLLAGANCDLTYHGIDTGFWNIDCISKRTLRNEARQEARWRSEGASYAGDHLERLPAVLAVRLLRTFDLYQPRRMVRFAEGRLVRADQIGVVAYYLLAALAIAGGWLVRGARRDLLVLLAPLALVFALSLIGYGIPRFRAPAEVTIVVLAAVAIERLAERRQGLSARRRPSVARPSA